MSGERGLVNGDALRGEAEVLVKAGHLVEGGVLVAERGGAADEAEEGVDGFGLEASAGVENGAPGAGVESEGHGVEA